MYDQLFKTIASIMSDKNKKSRKLLERITIEVANTIPYNPDWLYIVEYIQANRN